MSKRQYYKDDFDLIEHGEKENYAIPFKFVYYTNDKVVAYVAYYDGRAYKNCYLNEDGTLTVEFCRHRLAPGILECDKTFYVECPTGKTRKDCTHTVYDVELTEDETSCGTIYADYKDSYLILDDSNAYVDDEGYLHLDCNASIDNEGYLIIS